MSDLGHNNPPPTLSDELADRLTKFTEAAGVWHDRKKVDSEDSAGKLNDFLDGARKLHKLIDTERKEKKKPHDDAAKAVQDAYAPALNRLDKITKMAKAMLGDWLSEQARIERERKEREREAAEKARLEAEAAAREAESRGDFTGAQEAEDALKAAQAAEKQAAKPVRVNVASATGAGRTASLRSTAKAKVTSVALACTHFKDHPELIATLERLATQEYRAAADKAAVKIAGIEFEITKGAA
jgi:hypothetical protein